MAQDFTVKAVGDDLDNFMTKLMIQLSLEATSTLKEETPVDLNWARANWAPYIGEPPDRPIGERPEEGGAQFSESASTQLEAIVAATYKLPDGAIFVNNNVPYILALNDGHSSQAPRGFIQMAIAKAVAEVARSRS